MKKKYCMKKWPTSFLIKKNYDPEIKHLFTISPEINYVNLLKLKGIKS